jgi:hypothetical protein
LQVAAVETLDEAAFAIEVSDERQRGATLRAVKELAVPSETR